jgi:ribonucleoside-diphosphate reductase alpha chain
MQLFDMLINVISQGKTRRGNFAAYLPIDHPDIDEFLTIRTEGSPIQDLSSASASRLLDGGDDRRRRDKKRKVWARCSAGPTPATPTSSSPTTPTATRRTCYKDKGLRITHSNLCTEIMLPDNADESFVCDLSSMNILYFDEWKDTDAVELLVYFLDAVMTEFIEKAKKIKFMERAVRFAERTGPWASAGSAGTATSRAR